MPNDDRRAESKFLSLLAILVVLAYWKVVFTRQYTYFLGSDLAGQYYPWYQFAGWVLKSGHFPLWDPYTRGGRLFFDEMQPGVFYPLNLILFLLPARNGGVDLRSMDLLIVLSSLIAGLGQYFLLRSLKASHIAGLVGGTVFALGGYTAYMAGHQAIFEGVIWLPWILRYFLKALDPTEPKRLRACSWAALFLGLTILAGHIQPPGHTCLILLFFTVGAVLRKGTSTVERLKAFGVLLGTIGFALCVAAVQLIPTYLYSLRAYRWVTGGHMDPAMRVPFELHEVWSPATYLSLLVAPDGDNRYYLGIAPLLLAVYGCLVSKHRYRVLFSVMAVLAMLYSWGRISSLYSTIYLSIPFVEKIPEAGRSFFMFHFSMAVLAGLGADVLTRPVRRAARRRFDLTSLILGLSGSAILLVLTGIVLFQVLAGQPAGAKGLASLSASATLLFLTLGVILLRRYSFCRLSFLKGAIVFLTAFDLVSFVQAHTPPKGPESADRVYARTPSTEFLRSAPGIFRVMDIDGSMPLNFGDVYKIESVSGYGATLRKDYLDFLDAGSPPSSATRMLNVRYYASRKGIPQLTCVHMDEQRRVGVYEDPLALPRLGFVRESEVRNKENLSLGRLLLDSAQARHDGSDAVVLPSHEKFEGRILSRGPNETVLYVKTENAGYLWISELAYPGWSVYVDKKQEQLLTSDGIFRAVHLSPGEHVVEFRFRPAFFYVGLVITGLSLAAFLAVLISISDPRARTHRTEH